MRRHEDRKVKFFPDLIEHVHEQAHALHVHARERFVEDQDVRHRLERQREQDPLQLAARQRADALVDERLTVDIFQTREDLFPHGLRRPQEGGTAENAAGEQIHHAHRIAAVKGRALRHVADAQLRLLAGGLMEGDLPLVVALAENGADERGFSRAVRPDQRDHLAAVHVQVDIVEDRLAADADGQMLDLQTAGVFAVARVRMQMWDHESASRIVSMFL